MLTGHSVVFKIIGGAEASIIRSNPIDEVPSPESQESHCLINKWCQFTFQKKCEVHWHCFCYGNHPGANWFTWTRGNDGLPRARWSSRTQRLTRITRKTGTTGKWLYHTDGNVSLYVYIWDVSIIVYGLNDVSVLIYSKVVRSVKTSWEQKLLTAPFFFLAIRQQEMLFYSSLNQYFIAATSILPSVLSK